MLNTIREYLPPSRTPLLEDAIRAVKRLPCVGDWSPGPLISNMVPREVLWGLSFTFLSDIPSFDGLRMKIGSRIGHPDPSDLSELSAAGLVKAVGIRRLERVKEAESNTPDFHLWWEDELIEMEVTKANRKQALIDRSAAVDRLTNEIRSLDRPCDFVIHVADIPNEADRQQILQAARNVQTDSLIEENGRWCVRAISPNRHGNYHVLGQESDKPPAWWPETDVTRIFYLQQQIGGPNPDVVYPQVRVQFGTPFTSYINAASKKVDHFQGSGHVPFIIAVDIMSLPGALEFFPRDLPEYFKAWPRISAVWLIHGPTFAFPQIGWMMWKLIHNPDARNPLPASMVENLGHIIRSKLYDLLRPE